MKQFKLNDLGSDINEAVISEWLRDEGDKLARGDDLLEVVTDKASFIVPIPYDGILVKKCVVSGDEVAKEDIIAELKPV